jgi:hypothetical protein
LRRFAAWSERTFDLGLHRFWSGLGNLKLYLLLP